MHGLFCSPTVPPGLSMHKCGAAWCYLSSACPALCHSESGRLIYLWENVGPQGLLVVQLPAPLSHTPPVSVLPGQCESSLSWMLSPPLLPVWMNVYFLSPWCQTSVPFDFLSVLGVQGGTVCLPTPPSWFSLRNGFKVSRIVLLL